MNSTKVAIFLAHAILVSGCATTRVVDRPTQITAGEDTGLVYFYRGKAFVGGGISYAIRENGTKLGVLKNGTFFVVNATPGPHTYEAKTESGAAVSLNVEAGKTYYVRGSVKMGVFAGP